MSLTTGLDKDTKKEYNVYTSLKYKYWRLRMSNPGFKTPQGVFKTKSLFYETTLGDKTGVIFTLKDDDHEGFISLKRLYLETEDPTEYQFANVHLGGWNHWLKLKESDWFIPHLEQWRLELELRLKAKAFMSIHSEARSGDKNKFLANKYILEQYKNFVTPEGDKPSKGRPSKDDINKAAYKIAADFSSTDEDYQRILGTNQMN